MSQFFKVSALIALSFLLANIQLGDGKLIFICYSIAFDILFLFEFFKLSLSNITNSNAGLAFRAAGEGMRDCRKQTGYEDIDNVKDCQKFASDARKSFRKTESSSFSPKGCYLYRNQAVFYNFHSTGGERSDESPLCIAIAFIFFRISVSTSFLTICLKSKQRT